MKLRNRILIQTLSASLVFTLFLSLLFFLTVSGIRKMVLSGSVVLGDSAADIGVYALEEQVTDKIAGIAADIALILDEKLLKIENHTRMTADIAGSIYTNKEAWPDKPLLHVRPGEITPAEPYLHAAPGVDLSAIQSETDLAGNIGEILRQIIVVDRGITTSSIGGEAGYIIAMDAFPWPSEDFDPRFHSWYHGAKETGDLYWTSVYLDPQGRGPAISCAMPFYDQSGGGRVFKGVARSTVMFTDFSKIIDSAKVGRSGYLFLLEQSGIKLFSSGSVEVETGENGGIEGENFFKSRDPRLRSLAFSMTLGANGMTELEMDGVPVYVAYAPVHTLGWSLGVAIPAQEISVPAWIIDGQIQTVTAQIRAGMDRYIIFLAGFIGFVLLLSLLTIALLLVKFTAAITNPILALNEGVREVSRGNLDREVRIKTGDELEQLAASFNNMTIRLKNHIAEIARATAEKERISVELDVATQIQTSMMPNEFPPFPNRKNEFDLYAAMHPAKEVSGDFYDFFFIDDDHFAVIMADVSGKGIPAALFMAIARTLIKNYLQSGTAPAPALGNTNRQLCQSNRANMFVTAWLGVLEISSGRLSYINAGHNPPLLKSRDRPAAFFVSPPDLVLAGAEGTVYHCRETSLEDGDTLFLYTDGIAEAENTEGYFYGKERLRHFLDVNGGLSLRELLPALRGSIEKFSGGAEQSDDITMLALRLSREQPSPFLTLRADIAELEKLIGFIGRKLDAESCPAKTKGQIELAAEEIFVNIVKHGYKSGLPDIAEGGAEAGAAEAESGEPSCGEFEVVVKCGIERRPAGTTMTLRFIDRGEPFDPRKHADPDLSLPPEQREAGGLGILIVKRTMDTIEYSYEGGTNRLTITKSWPPENRAA
ncbi:MAG: SpoIIE family protein phosphatase [Treponema sp.]|jgi:sigma-B regulation protein RsbU (phosphoserine phosphatase)|nr:SpoIIE family protein phosphatase [Treponema sp.]